jgi:hypothetical protein
MESKKSSAKTASCLDLNDLAPPGNNGGLGATKHAVNIDV